MGCRARLLGRAVGEHAAGTEFQPAPQLRRVVDGVDPPLQPGRPQLRELPGVDVARVQVQCAQIQRLRHAAPSARQPLAQPGPRQPRRGAHGALQRGDGKGGQQHRRLGVAPQRRREAGDRLAPGLLQRRRRVVVDLDLQVQPGRLRARAQGVAQLAQAGQGLAGQLAQCPPRLGAGTQHAAVGAQQRVVVQQEGLAVCAELDVALEAAESGAQRRAARGQRILRAETGAQPMRDEVGPDRLRAWDAVHDPQCFSRRSSSP